jgi:hypothetical protein
MLSLALDRPTKTICGKWRSPLASCTIFDDDINVVKAALIPIALVIERSTFIARTNGNKFILRDDVWNAPGVRDVTAEIAAATPFAKSSCVEKLVAD